MAKTQIEPVLPKRASLHEEIVANLRDMILEGALRPGEAVPEAKLCEELQISRTPLREALKVLAAEDYVTLLPNKGCVVREIIPEEIEDLFEVMHALEGLVGSLVALRATDADIAELREMHERLLSFKAAGDRQRYFQLNQAIHRRLAFLSGNRILSADYAGYADKIKRARYLANDSIARWTASVEEHVRIMEALEAGDGERLAKLLQEHIRLTGIAVVYALKQMQRKGGNLARALA